MLHGEFVRMNSQGARMFVHDFSFLTGFVLHLFEITFSCVTHRVPAADASSLGGTFGSELLIATVLEPLSKVLGEALLIVPVNFTFCPT